MTSDPKNANIPANIENFVDQEVNVPRNVPLLPVFEAVHNALDAIGERGIDGEIVITVERHVEETDGSRGAPYSFQVSDNGVGLNKANTQSFNLLFTPRKKASGGKGRGRFTYLKVFDDVSVESVYEEDNLRFKKHFSFGYGFQSAPDSGKKTTAPVGTKITLLAMRAEYARNVRKQADELAREFITHFLPTLLTKPNIKLILKDPDPIDLANIVRSELLIDGAPEPFVIGTRSFELSHVRMHARPGLHHRLILAAAGREVDGVSLEKEIPVLSKEPLGTEPPFFALGIVQGDYLDEIADPTRLGFRTEKSVDDENAGHDHGDLLGDPSSVGSVRRKAVELITKHLEDDLEHAVLERTNAVTDFIRHDGMGYHFLRGRAREIAQKLRTKDDKSIEAALHTAAYDERVNRKATVKALLSATPKEKEEIGYYQRWEKVVGQISDVAKSELAEYVLHRRAILDLLSDLLRVAPEGKHRREEILHNIIFPIRAQSGEVSYEQQNLWLIDERLTFHEHLYSDKSVKRITRGGDSADQRPDLAIFETGFASFHDAAKPTSQIILVELKKPARDDASKDDPVGKSIEYVRKIKSGRARTEGGAVIDIDDNALTTVYLLADWTRDFKEYLDRENFQPFPGEEAQYFYREKDKIMFIAISFERLIETARRRNMIFFKKLGVE